jgi:hypothetical protein
MSKWQQVYYNAVFGAIGGLLGWLLVGSVRTADWEIWLAYAFVGAGVGLCIGAMVGAVEGVVVKRSASRALVGALAGGVAGLVGGVLGLLIGELGFLLLHGGVLGRSLGWMFLGLFLGLGQGVVSRKLKRASYGTVGGAVAGLVGGVLYETMTQLFLEQSDRVQMIVSGVGLILVGACLGGLIPVSVEAIARVAGRGTLRVMNGRREGLERLVLDAVTLGSYDGCDVYLPGDPGIDAKHAVVYKGSGGFSVRNVSTRGVPLQVAGQALPPGAPDRPLRTGDTLVLGQTAVRFTAG